VFQGIRNVHRNSLSARSVSFWRDRLATHGHTGWKDRLVYAYDQRERLALIDRALSKPVCRGARAIDFGCGTGDFCRLLLNRGYEVCGYDPVVAPPIRSSRFHYATSYEEIPWRKGEAEIAISVTTLDHIPEPSAAIEAVAVIRRLLSDDGQFHLIEYALDHEDDRRGLGHSHEFQAFRTVEKWRELLAAGGFRIVSVNPAPHPQFNPSPGYRAYRNAKLIRWRNRFPANSLGRRGLDALLPQLAAHYVRKFPFVAAGPSPLKVLCCTAV
jgi:SAM-dependent methyltransferase